MIETMAVRITDDITYNLAVACLPAGFINVPRDNIIGNAYLIINDFVSQDVAGGSPVIALENVWNNEQDFNAHYRFRLLETQGVLASVERFA